MERTLSNFIRALRNAEVRVSTAETLDAFLMLRAKEIAQRLFAFDDGEQQCEEQDHIRTHVRTRPGPAHGRT